MYLLPQFKGGLRGNWYLAMSPDTVAVSCGPSLEDWFAHISDAVKECSTLANIASGSTSENIAFLALRPVELALYLASKCSKLARQTTHEQVCHEHDLPCHPKFSAPPFIFKMYSECVSDACLSGDFHGV